MTAPLASIGLSVGAARRRSALARALGSAIAEALEAPDVVEAMVNADGRLWLDRIGSGLAPTAHVLSPHDREAAIRLIAHEAGETVGEHRPALQTILPDSAARIQALLPPLVEAPILAIRKRPATIFTLADYVRDGIATPEQAKRIGDALREKRNIVVAGGTGSGKTTLLNALLAEPCLAGGRLIVLEDTPELQVSGANTVQLLTRRADPHVTLRDLVQVALRLRPDRIIVGEARGAEVLDVLKAWNTGHPGGLLTLHANSAQEACLRLEDLCLEAQTASPRRLIASAVDLIVFIARTASGRRITELLDLRTTTHSTKGDLE